MASFATWAAERTDDVVVAVLPTSGALPRVPAPLVDLMDTRWLENSLDLRVPPVVEIVWRLVDVLVGGTPADLADFSTTGRPAIASPGTTDLPFTVPTDTAALLSAVETSLGGHSDPNYAAWGRALHTRSDGRSAARLVRRLKQTYLPWKDWLAALDDTDVTKV